MAGRIAAATLEQIRSANDIVDIIGAYLPLKRAGANFVALCPFHREKTPSFNVSPQRQIFHCFGCHKGGDVFTFIRDYEQVDFMEAVRRLAERAGIRLDFEAGGDQTRQLKETLYQIHEQATQRWQAALQNDAAGQIARDYLVRRGVSPEAVKLFRLGYAPEAWDDTVNWAKSKQFDLALVEQAGLIVRKEDEHGRYYDRFRGRLIFPICDEQGRVVAFSGRILAEEVKTAKYVNSPETPIFAKRKIFYGLDKSKRAILDAQFAVVCEGQLDLIACFMAGVKNIVAPQGTALTADHARLLKRYVSEVVLCFDSDLAGQSAAVRVLDDLLACGLAIRVATVPAPHDPDSFIKTFGGEAFHQLINQAEGFFDFYLNHLCRRNDLATDKGRLAVVKAMGEALRKTRHPVLLDTYAQKTALRLHVSPQAIRDEFNKIESPGTAERFVEEAEEIVPPAPPSPKEFWLLKYIFLEESDIDWVAAHLDVQWLQHPAVHDIVSLRLEAQANQSWRGVAAFLSDVTDLAAQRLLAEAVADPRPIPNAQQQLEDVLRWLRNRTIDDQLLDIHRQLSQSGIADETVQDLLVRQQKLRQEKKQSLSPRRGAVDSAVTASAES